MAAELCDIYDLLCKAIILPMHKHSELPLWSNIYISCTNNTLVTKMCLQTVTLYLASNVEITYFIQISNLGI